MGFSLVSRSEKLLDADCEGHFLTEPALVGLPIPELFEFVPAVFPCEAFLIADATLESSLRYLSNSIVSSPVTLLEEKTETSLIASSVLDPEVAPPESAMSGASLLHIPLDDCLSAVDVAIVEMEKSEMEKLRDETTNVLDCLDLSKLKSYRDVGSDRSNSVQSLFYTSIRKGDESVGVELDAPTRPCVAAAMQEKEETIPPPAQSNSENVTEDEYVEIISPQEVYADGDMSSDDVKMSPEQYNKTDSHSAPKVACHDRDKVVAPALPPRGSPNPTSNTREYQIVGRQSPRHYSHHRMPGETKQTNADIRDRLLSEITEIKSAVLQLGERVETLERAIKALPQSVDASKQESRDVQTKNNRLYLRSLDVSKVSIYL